MASSGTPVCINSLDLVCKPLKNKIKEGSIYVVLELTRDVSSAGLEHCLDKAGVAGSSPVHPTNLTFFTRLGFGSPD